MGGFGVLIRVANKAGCQSVIYKQLIGPDPSLWRWYLDEVFIRINGKRPFLWRTVDHEEEALESYVTKRRGRKLAFKFLRKAMRKYGQPDEIVTDRLRSCGAAMKVIGNADW